MGRPALFAIVILGVCMPSEFHVTAETQGARKDLLQDLMKHMAGRLKGDRKISPEIEEFDALVAAVTSLQSEVAQIAMDVAGLATDLDETNTEIARVETDLMAEIETVRENTLEQCETGYIDFNCRNEFPVPVCCVEDICRSDGYFDFELDITFSQAFRKAPAVLATVAGATTFEAFAEVTNNLSASATTTGFHLSAFVFAFDITGAFEWIAC